jgi:hypothetical protein
MRPSLKESQAATLLDAIIEARATVQQLLASDAIRFDAHLTRLNRYQYFVGGPVKQLAGVE